MCSPTATPSRPASPPVASSSGPTFLDNYYGSPVPEPTAQRDVVLEIEVDGAGQVKALHPEAILIFVLPPSREEQQRRLRDRGDPEDKVDQRLQKALDEEPVGLALADHIVVNDDLERTVRRDDGDHRQPSCSGADPPGRLRRCSQEATG